MHIEELQHAAEYAAERRDNEINRLWPIGTRVGVKRGNGVMNGTVEFEATGGRLRVRSDTGHLHHVWWQDMREPR